MRVLFDVISAASPSGRAASLREQTKLAAIACGMRRFCEVAINVTAPLSSSPRWEHFRSLRCRWDSYDYLVSTELASDVPDVVVKVSEGCMRDEALLSSPKCRVLVAHEYDTSFENHPKLLPVPWIAHERTLDALVEANLFAAYLNDDLETIRAAFVPETRKKKVAFCGVRMYGRDKLAQKVPAEYSAIILYDEHPVMEPVEYLRWIACFAAGYDFPGNTPKTNRFSDLVMLGVVVARTPCELRVTPDLNDSNSIVLSDWDDAEAIRRGLENVDALREGADHAYRYGWSPSGIAALIYERLEGQGSE